MSDATIWWAAELDASDREKLLQLLKTKPEVNPVGQRLPFEVRNDMNITKETAPVGTRVLILDESDTIREATVVEYSPEGRVKMQFDTWTRWFGGATAVNAANVIEILEPLTDKRGINALLTTLRELFDDDRWTALGIRVQLARILTEFGLPTDPPNE